MAEFQPSIARIRNKDNLWQAVRECADRFPDLQVVVSQLDDIPLRPSAPGFAGLAQIITAQQVSKASATAIYSRMTTLIQPFDAHQFLVVGERPLIEAGQSRAKQVALLGLARAIVDDDLDLEGLCDLPAETAIAKLTALKGIGPWTAEVFLLFCAGHIDIFPAGDVALQHAVANLFRLEDRPDGKQTRRLAKAWQPMRGVAARILYAHYARLKGRSAL
ncbi:MAG: DNA-3-methyladenine glycosylase family protein [Rhizobiaceae bacterium]